jgi:3-hydroxyacyl-CoA dehydrogenase
MTAELMPEVACVGSGAIGRSWAWVFLRAGCRTRLYDPSQDQLERAKAWLAEEARRDATAGLIEGSDAGDQLARLSTHTDLAEALVGVDYVQESVPEHLELKQRVFGELDRLAPPRAILASSVSGLDINDFTAGLPGAWRCVVAHPVNPPHVVPVVELLGSQAADPEVVARARELLVKVGQQPLVMRRYVPGYVLNRLQLALVREAIGLVDDGVASPEDIDLGIREGLGLRWALIGPFVVAHTNDDAGVRAYYDRPTKSVRRAVMEDLYPTPDFNPEQIERIGQGVDAMVAGASVAELQAWRDEMIKRLRALKRDNPMPSSTADDA